MSEAKSGASVAARDPAYRYAHAGYLLSFPHIASLMRATCLLDKSIRLS